MEGSINRVYVDFEPVSERVQEEDSETLLLFLPGFKREQLKVQITTTKKVRISGQRPLGDEKWSRFEKDYPTSANCDANNISAKFENAVLYVKQPKLITPAKEEDQASPNIVASKLQNLTDQTQPPKNVQQQYNQEANQTNGSAKSVPEKAIEKKESIDAKSVSENASERGKAREEEKSRDFSSEEGKSMGKTIEKHEKGNSSTVEGGESKQENAFEGEKEEEKNHDFPSAEEGKSTGKTSEKHEKGNSSTVKGGESKQENASEREKAQKEEKIRDFPSSEEGKSTGKTSEKHEKMDSRTAEGGESKQENREQDGGGGLMTILANVTTIIANVIAIFIPVVRLPTMLFTAAKSISMWFRSWW